MPLHKTASACILRHYCWIKKISEEPTHCLSNPDLPVTCQTCLPAGSKPWCGKSAPARCTVPTLKKLKREKSTSLSRKKIVEGKEPKTFKLTLLPRLHGVSTEPKLLQVWIKVQVRITKVRKTSFCDTPTPLQLPSSGLGTGSTLSPAFSIQDGNKQMTCIYFTFTAPFSFL